MAAGTRIRSPQGKRGWHDRRGSQIFYRWVQVSHQSRCIGSLLIPIDYPSYELYTDHLRNGIWGGVQGKQLRLVVGKDRKVKKVVEM